MKAGQLAKDITARLREVSECSDFEARCLLTHYFDVTLNDIYLNKEIDIPSFDDLETAVHQRLQHVPLQYILGKWEFMGHEFFVNESVLIPRPETELLCECLVDKLSKESVVFDLCAGTGCVAVSIEKMTGAKVLAFEKYEDTFCVLQKNILYHHCSNVEPILQDITKIPKPLLPEADVILSNPPYIETNDLAHLQAEVLREPRTALDGGADGLVYYRAIAENFLGFLKPGGYLAVEIGEGQEEEVKNIFSSLRHVQTIKDYNDIKRVVMFRKDTP